MKEYEIRTVTHGTAILLARTQDDWFWTIVEKHDAMHNKKPKALAWAKWDDDFGFLDVGNSLEINEKHQFGMILAFWEVERHILEERDGTVRGLILGIHGEIKTRLKMLAALTERIAASIDSKESFSDADHTQLAALYSEINDLRAKLDGINMAIRLKAQKTPLRTE